MRERKRQKGTCTSGEQCRNKYRSVSRGPWNSFGSGNRRIQCPYFDTADKGWCDCCSLIASLLIVSPHLFFLSFLLATMPDTPELGDLILEQLGRHNLAQCALVSKKWHTLVIPHLWRDTSGTSPYPMDDSVRIFFQTIQEDYTAEQRYKEWQDAEPSTQAQPSRAKSFTLPVNAHQPHCCGQTSSYVWCSFLKQFY
jgi:hypothetical protein